MNTILKGATLGFLVMAVLSVSGCSKGKRDQYTYEQEREYLVVDPKYGFSKRHQAQFNREKRKEEKEEKKAELARKKARRLQRR